MSLQRDAGGGSGPGRPEKVGRLAGTQEERRIVRDAPVAVGTLACPRCDAPVIPAGPVSPASPLHCPFCPYTGAVRDFLSLGEPTRPARVVVRLALRP